MSSDSMGRVRVCVFLSAIDRAACDKYACMCENSSGLFCYTW